MNKTYLTTEKLSGTKTKELSAPFFTVGSPFINHFYLGKFRRYHNLIFEQSSNIDCKIILTILGKWEYEKL